MSMKPEKNSKRHHQERETSPNINTHATPNKNTDRTNTENNKAKIMKTTTANIKTITYNLDSNMTLPHRIWYIVNTFTHTHVHVAR